MVFHLCSPGRHTPRAARSSISHAFIEQISYDPSTADGGDALSGCMRANAPRSEGPGNLGRLLRPAGGRAGHSCTVTIANSVARGRGHLGGHGPGRRGQISRSRSPLRLAPLRRMRTTRVADSAARRHHYHRARPRAGRGGSAAVSAARAVRFLPTSGKPPPALSHVTASPDAALLLPRHALGRGARKVPRLRKTVPRGPAPHGKHAGPHVHNSTWKAPQVGARGASRPNPSNRRPRGAATLFCRLRPTAPAQPPP